MPSERVQRQIDRLLDEAEDASAKRDWLIVRERAEHALTFDPDNTDARALLAAAERGMGATPEPALTIPPTPTRAPVVAQPTSFANGRYTVRKFLGEGGKKKVYLAHDALLDRDVAFALIKTDGLDEASRTRITREAQAMGRLGDHPNIVTVYDIGEEDGAPYMVLPVLAGGDVEGVIEKAPEQRMPLEQALKIAIETCRGLEFAHGRGIVHRDLKPGNVWLSEDGTAKIGDFGLAVATDRSRLTQAGMMVGTVSYMPPEQAMGGEVGPRSDLYSLGAMLYEMVCGRPPFVGDESVAIIGQHLNTPPVAPIWHRPDCPPALETLLLRLLEKDPSKRPANATEVREALENVSQGRIQAPRDPSITAEAPTAGDNPLYRRTFVGREHEVSQLQQAFDAALSGQGGLVMVVGEPGIGKTALCEQLATYVALRGGKALVGHCYEEGSLSLPYLAFVEAMRSYVLAREPDGLRSDLGTGAADVARIVSEVRDRVQGVELRTASDPEDDRWRLLQSVTSFLKNASTVQPLCIVLEDLHWADRGTLDLLINVARNLQGSRLLIVGTYRDVEVDRSHPLSGTLAELSRATSFQRIRLRGLTVDEVHRMYEAIRGQVTPWSQAEAVHRQTEGNPLFVQEVLRYLVEEGIVVREAGRWVRTDGGEPGAGVPEGLRDVIGKRLSRLSAETNRILAIASVIGRDFNLATVSVIADGDEEQLVSSLDEAVRVGVLEERGHVGGAVSFRFAHAFFRQTLYEELGAARRIRLHQQVGKALEELYLSRVVDHAAELAEHFSHSSAPSDLEKAVRYGEAAAQRAISVFDYGEAVRLLERAIDVQEVLDPDDQIKRCDLLLTLGEATLPQEDPGRVADTVALQAFTLAEAMASNKRAARAALLALEGLNRGGGLAARSSEEFQIWAARANSHAEDGTTERVLADAYLGLANLTATNDPADGHAYLRKAVSGAIGLTDNTVFFAAAGFAFQLLNALRDRQVVNRLADEVLARPRDGVRNNSLALSLSSARVRLMDIGERERAEKAAKELDDLAERTRDATIHILAMGSPTLFSFIDGRLLEAVGHFETADLRGKETGVTASGVAATGAIGLCSILAHLYLGRGREFLVNLPAGRGGRAAKALLAAEFGEHEEARALRQSFGDVAAEQDESHMVFLSNLLWSGIVSQDKEFVRGLAPRFNPFAGELVVPVSIGRLCGDAAALLGQPSEARSYYAQAIEICDRVQFRPERALTRLSLAELLLDHYPDEHDAAIEHLDFAIAELRDMKMQPALERALRHRGLLNA